ncbi:hypothetical protein F4Z99_11510 [Candidatus Poribacteria bacterium]|nr:hypothetical protein [Candidatus Poribacteria bacterium]
MYTLEDLTNPIVVYTYDAGYNILEKAIINAFHEDMPHACLDDIPYVEYNPDTGEVEVDDKFYEIDRELQDYLNDARKQLHSVPLPQIKLKSIEIQITHPETEDEKGFMKIGAYRPSLN